MNCYNPAFSRPRFTNVRQGFLFQSIAFFIQKYLSVDSSTKLTGYICICSFWMPIRDGNLPTWLNHRKGHAQKFPAKIRPRISRNEQSFRIYRPWGLGKRWLVFSVSCFIETLQGGDNDIYQCQSIVIYEWNHLERLFFTKQFVFVDSGPFWQLIRKLVALMLQKPNGKPFNQRHEGNQVRAMSTLLKWWLNFNYCLGESYKIVNRLFI
jgi:hypothetical protein